MVRKEMIVLGCLLIGAAFARGDYPESTHAASLLPPKPEEIQRLRWKLDPGAQPCLGGIWAFTPPELIYLPPVCETECDPCGRALVRGSVQGSGVYGENHPGPYYIKNPPAPMMSTLRPPAGGVWYRPIAPRSLSIETPGPPVTILP